MLSSTIEIQSGERREGLFYGGTTFTYKLASGLAIMLSGFLLSATGYDRGSQVQTPEVILGIKIAVGIIPGLLLLFGAYLAARYPLTAKKHGELVKQLEARKASDN